MGPLAQYLGRACLTSWTWTLGHRRLAQLALLDLFRVIIVELDALLLLELRTVRPAVFKGTDESGPSTSLEEP